MTMSFHWSVFFFFWPVGHNDECKVHDRYLFLTEKDLRLSQCAGEVLHTRLFWLFYIRRWAFSSTRLRRLFCSQVLWRWPHRLISNYYCGWQLTCRDMAVFLHQRTNLAFGLRLRCRGWWTAAGPVSSVLFIDLKTTNPASQLTSMVSSPYTLLIGTGLEPSAVKIQITTLRIVCTSTKSAILHCYCVECTGMTGESMILVELDRVAIRSVRQETLVGAIFNKKKKRGHYFRADFLISIPDVAPLTLRARVSLWTRIPHYTVQSSPGHLDYVGGGGGGCDYSGIWTTEAKLRGIGNIQKIITPC